MIYKKGDAKPSDWPQWLCDADIEWCDVRIDYGGNVMWLDGHWLGGTWSSGEWLSGNWRSGVWRGGNWRSGIWRGGEWSGGTWYVGIWHAGIWHAGIWHAGEWRAGTWRGGEWHGGDWYDGTWRSGAWYGGEWHSGYWRSGDWHGGDWRSRNGWWRGASISWPEHGECGRTLRTLMHDDGRVQHSCGCFSGNDGELLSYIAKGDPTLRSSRQLARRINLALLEGTAEEVFEIRGDE